MRIPPRPGRRAALPLALAALLLRTSAAPAEDTRELASFGSIERKDHRIDKLIPAGAKIEKLAEGYNWAEGPVWDRKEHVLLFSDVPENTVFRWKEGAGVREFLKPSGYTGKAERKGEPGSNGLLIDSDGRLVLCQHGDRRVARLEGGKFVTLADKYDGKRFNSPNDGVFNKKGDLYFTDPPYGLEGLNSDPKKELPFNGVYRVSKDGEVTLLTKSMTFPNGIALSPDEKTLYVANSDASKALWMAFPVKEDGTIGEGKVFKDVTDTVKGRKGLPDGLKVDRDGNLFATAPGGVLVLSPEGDLLGTLATGEATANCAWGGDGSELFIAADMYIGRVKTKTKGKGF